jgi:hypothetical protein
MQYIHHKNIDIQKWDNCIDHSVNRIIYAYSWYLDIVCDQWDGLIQGDYESVMPLPFKYKYGFRYIYPPLFCQQLGVFSIHVISQDLVNEFLNAIPNENKLVELNLNVSNAFLIHNYQTKSNSNYEINLGNPYEAIYSFFSDNLKRNIKKAGKSGLTITSDVSFEEVLLLFKKYNAKNFGRVSNYFYSSMQNIVNKVSKKDKAKICTIGAKDHHNKLRAGTIWMITNDRAIYFFSAYDGYAKEVGAMHFLLNHFIQQHAGKKMILDFEGSNQASLARFYKSFGSKERVYLFVKRNNLPKIIKWLKK